MRAELDEMGGFLAEALDAHFPKELARRRQVMCLLEEVGESLGAARRWKGWARRAGSIEEVASELADVVITAAVTAATYGVVLVFHGESDLDYRIGEEVARVSQGIADGTRDWETPMLDLSDRAEMVKASAQWEAEQNLGLYLPRIARDLGSLVVRAYVAAGTLGIDLDAAIDVKWKVITTRGYRDERIEDGGSSARGLGLT